MQKRKRVYIAGPISKGSLVHNVNQSTDAFVTLAKAGFAPFNPMWSVYGKMATWWDSTKNQTVCIGTVNGNDDMTHADWMGIDLPWVECAHAVLRLPGESVGADMECKHAELHSIPVFHSIEQLLREITA